MRYVSLFSGVEAATLAWEPLGWEAVAFAEIEPFPSAVLAERWPDVPNLGDVTKVDWRPYRGAVDVVVGGSPCFTAGTLVLCEGGFKPIEEVEVGDLVVTHKGRLRRVLDTGSRIADVGILKACGVMPIECTPTHPVLVSRRTKRSKADENGSWFSFKSEEFVPAKDSMGLCACMVVDTNCQTPEFPKMYGLDNVEIAELIGWYLGDGSIAGKGRKNPTLRTLELSISPTKLVDFVAQFKQKLNYRVERIDDTRCRVLIHCTEFCNFLERHFGRGAANKNIPAWALALPDSEREAIVRGYMATDGHSDSRGVSSAESASKALSIGIQLLSRIGSVCKPAERDLAVIDGVEYHAKPTYKVTLGKDGGRCQIDNGYAKRLIKSFTPLGTATVYNLEVEDDNSYTADGIAVHNCQAFSVAGKRRGLMDERGLLMLEYVRAVAEIAPRWFLWENVPGVLSQDGGRAFGTLLREMDELGYGMAWRVLDAQFFGVAQRRRRVFLVGCLGAGGGASAVLFEPEGVFGDTPSSKEKRQALAADARSGPAGADGRGDCLTPWDVQSKRVNSPDGVCPTLQSGTHENQSIEPLVMASGQANAEICEGGG